MKTKNKKGKPFLVPILLAAAIIPCLFAAQAHAATSGQKLLALCAKELKISENSKDPALVACAYGYTLAISGEKVSKCGDKYSARAEFACEKKGYPLGKKDPLNIGSGKKNGDDNGGKQGDGGGNNPGDNTVKFTNISSAGLPQPKANQGTINTVLQIVFGFIGAFALLSITASGMKYITSAGNEQRTSEAKSGIAYSLVGLAIAITAEAIVTFMVNRAS